MHIITDTKTLQDFCHTLKGQEFITIDTEFMREKTYWPLLCLVQVACETDAVIIDALAPDLSLDPLLAVLADSTILKVFHAARQDIEIFFRLMQAVPTPIFDTQIAAMACGYGDQIGYEPLVRAISNKAVDKGSRFTDWSIRPLSTKQLSYALGDVTYLRDVYHHLSQQLMQADRHHWVAEELAALSDPGLYHVTPAHAWRRLKLKDIRQRALGPLIAIAKWREEEAQKRNTPRAWILKDDAVLELARQSPRSPAELAKCRSIAKGFERSASAASLLVAIQNGLDTPVSSLPMMEKHPEKRPVAEDVLDLLRVLLKHQCHLYNVAPKLIANMKDLEKIARSDTADVPALSGWRYDVFGKQALQLKTGCLALKLNAGVLQLVETASYKNDSTPQE